MYRIIACFIAAFAAALTLGTTQASADDGHGHDHCGHGSHPECPPPPPDVPDGYNVIVGGGGNDLLNGTVFKDAIFGRAGNDRIRGKAGDDLLFGMVGNDILRGGLGTDVLRGGRGRDLCIGDTNDQFIRCERVVVLAP